MPLYFNYHQEHQQQHRSSGSLLKRVRKPSETKSTKSTTELKRKFSSDYEEDTPCDDCSTFSNWLPISSSTPILMEDTCDFSLDQKVKRIKSTPMLSEFDFNLPKYDTTLSNIYVNNNNNNNTTVNTLDFLNSNYERVEKIDEDEYAEYYRVTRKYDHKFCKLTLIKHNASGDNIYKLLSLRNANIVEITHCGLIGKRPFIETKWYKDGTLDQLLKRGEFISENSLVRMASSLLDSLLFIQDNNILCRDFRPSNIVVEREGNLEYDLRYTLEFIGFTTSPPQVSKQNVKAIGEILFMLMTRKPFMPDSITREYLLENISGIYSPKIVDLVLVLLFSDLSTCEILQFLH